MADNNKKNRHRLALLRNGLYAGAAVAAISIFVIHHYTRASNMVDDGLGNKTQYVPVVQSKHAGLSGIFLSAYSAKQNRDWPNAANFTASLAEIIPENLEFLRYSVLMNINAGNYEKAQHFIDILANKQDRDAITINAATVSALVAGKREKALELLSNKAVGQYLGSIGQAWLLLDKQPNDAKNIFAEKIAAAEKLPGLTMAFTRHRALIARAMHDEAGAAQWFEKLLAMQPAPRDAQLAINYFISHGQKQKAEELVKRYNNAADSLLLTADIKAADDQQYMKPEQGIALLFSDLGGVLLRNKETDIALFYARLALWLDPNNITAKLLLATILDDNGQTEQAFTILGNVHGLGVDEWSVGIMQANILQRQNKKAEALAILQKLHKGVINHAETTSLLGAYLQMEDKYAEAIKVYNQWLDHETGTARQKATMVFARALAYLESKDWPKAEKDMQEALRLDPENPSVLNHLAYSWIERGLQIDESIKLLEKAVSLKPNDGNVLDSLGWAYFKKGDYATAAEYIENALHYEPNHPTISDHLGDAYWQLGHYRQASFLWKKALKNLQEKEASDLTDEDKGVISALQKKLASGTADKSAQHTEPKPPSAGVN
ncbi:MAG: tetratricopeptide repeat protein [Alphaproteobacteria bacterium]